MPRRPARPRECGGASPRRVRSSRALPPATSAATRPSGGASSEGTRPLRAPCRASPRCFRAWTRAWRPCTALAACGVAGPCSRARLPSGASGVPSGAPTTRPQRATAATAATMRLPAPPAPAAPTRTGARPVPGACPRALASAPGSAARGLPRPARRFAASWESFAPPCAWAALRRPGSSSTLRCARGRCRRPWWRMCCPSRSAWRRRCWEPSRAPRQPPSATPSCG
mmetsp:Transcript_8241/g.32488  ORF Transcript_8241/g.32488 Transcript_8241/m.32488 type:complete len:227 (+) Transcript_8241:588-1268(+)